MLHDIDHQERQREIEIIEENSPYLNGVAREY